MADEVIQTPFGKFLVNPLDCIGTTLKAGTLWDGPGFLQPLAIEHGKLGTQGVTILDVGANIGAFTVWLARHGAWRVVAVEPVPQTMLYLKANLDLNQAVCGDVVIPLEVAGYDRRTRMAFAAMYQPDNMGGTALIEDAECGAIPAAPLDDYAHLWRGGLSLVKIDAQGCDGAVLQGLKATIAWHRPVLVFEWEADLAQRHALYGLQEVLIWLATTHRYEVHPWPSQPNNYVAIPSALEPR